MSDLPTLNLILGGIRARAETLDDRRAFNDLRTVASLALQGGDAAEWATMYALWSKMERVGLEALRWKAGAGGTEALREELRSFTAEEARIFDEAQDEARDKRQALARVAEQSGTARGFLARLRRVYPKTTAAVLLAVLAAIVGYGVYGGVGAAAGVGGAEDMGTTEVGAGDNTGFTQADGFQRDVVDVIRRRRQSESAIAAVDDLVRKLESYRSGSGPQKLELSDYGDAYVDAWREKFGKVLSEQTMRHIFDTLTTPAQNPRTLYYRLPYHVGSAVDQLKESLSGGGIGERLKEWGRHQLGWDEEGRMRAQVRRAMARIVDDGLPCDRQMKGLRFGKGKYAHAKPGMKIACLVLGVSDFRAVIQALKAKSPRASPAAAPPRPVLSAIERKMIRKRLLTARDAALPAAVERYVDGQHSDAVGMTKKQRFQHVLARAKQMMLTPALAGGDQVRALRSALQMASDCKDADREWMDRMRWATYLNSGAFGDAVGTDEYVFKLVQFKIQDGRTSQSPESFDAEVSMSRKLGEHGIGPKIFWTHKFDNVGVIAMERFAGDMFSFINNPPFLMTREDKETKVMAIILEKARRAVEKLGVASGDVRLENILYRVLPGKQLDVALIDFDDRKNIGVEDAVSATGFERARVVDGLWFLMVVRICMTMTAANRRTKAKSLTLRDVFPETIKGKTFGLAPFSQFDALKAAWNHAGKDFFDELSKTEMWKRPYGFGHELKAQHPLIYMRGEQWTNPLETLASIFDDPQLQQQQRAARDNDSPVTVATQEFERSDSEASDEEESESEAESDSEAEESEAEAESDSEEEESEAEAESDSEEEEESESEAESDSEEEESDSEA